MKKITLFAFLILLSLKHSTAQSLWIQSGFSYATAEYKYLDNNILKDETFKPRFQVGTMAELPLTPFFSVNPGFILQTKGTYQTYELLDPENKGGTDFKLLYLDIPVLLNLRIPFDKFGLFIEMGPYAGIGLFGAGKYYENIHEPYTEKVKMKWGEDDYMKRMEYGIMGGAGAEINRFKFGLSFTYSMTNVALADDFVYKNRVLTLFISYKAFGNVKK